MDLTSQKEKVNVCRGVNGKSGTLVTTGGAREYVCSCQYMHSVAAAPAEVQLCLESALLSDTDKTLA